MRSFAFHIFIFTALLALCLPISARCTQKLALCTRSLLRTLLGALALLSFLHYVHVYRTASEASWPIHNFHSQIDAYDLLHYYLNAKYFTELGYFGLYPALLFANKESGPFFKFEHKRVQLQNKNGFYWARYADFIANEDEHAKAKSAFSHKRWEDFKKDFIFLQRENGRFSPRNWYNLFFDHGYNGSPVWTSFFRPLTRIVPIQQVKYLCLVDPCILFLTALITFWTLGLEACFIFLIFMFNATGSIWPEIGYGIGRYDYVSLMLISVGLLKKKLPAAAGIFFGAASALRYFPVIWLIPLLGGLLYSARRDIALCRFYLRFLFSSLIIFLALHIVAAAAIGPEQVSTYFQKMKAHVAVENITRGRLGFAVAAAYRGEMLEKMDNNRRALIKSDEKWRIPLAIFLSAALAYLLRRSPAEEALALGFIPFFLWTTVSYHYAIVAVILVVFHTASAQKYGHALALGYLLLIEAVISYVFDTYPTLRIMHIGLWSWLLTGYVMGIMVWLALRNILLSLYHKQAIAFVNLD